MKPVQTQQARASGINRRQALARLGLAAAAVYLSPVMMSLSSATAASSPSPASPPSKPTAPSQPSGVEPGDGNSPNDKAHEQDRSRACGSGASRRSSAPKISRRDSRLAQRAVRDGRALPLNRVMARVHKKHGGKFLSIRFIDSNKSPRYRLKMLSSGGALVVIEAEAKNANIVRIERC